MRVIGRHDAILVAGLTLALAVVFARPISMLLDIAREVERDYGLALIPGLVILSISLGVHYIRKRGETTAMAAAAEAEARQAAERARELERLVGFGQALARALDLGAIRDALVQHLSRLAGRDGGWVLVRGTPHWDMLVGPPAEATQEHEASREQLLVRVLQQQEQGQEPNAQGSGIEVDHHVCFPLVVGGETAGLLGVPKGPEPLTPGQRRVLAAAAALLAVSIKNAQVFREVRDSSLHDTLTGCFNHAYGLEVVEVELRRARRTKRPIALIMFDLDRFKSLNDQFGHPCGDAVLAAIGRRLRDLLRGSDAKCRYGGEEFLILLPETPLAGAQHAAEMLRRGLADLAIPWNGETLHVTGSFGVAAARSDEVDPMAVIARADAALYDAKANGRNCVRVAPDPGQ